MAWARAPNPRARFAECVRQPKAASRKPLSKSPNGSKAATEPALLHIERGGYRQFDTRHRISITEEALDSVPTKDTNLEHDYRQFGAQWSPIYED